MKKERKDLYILLKQEEVRDKDYDEGDGSPYDGWRSYKKITKKMGPARISSESPDWDYDLVDKVDPRIFEDKPDHITVVVVDYWTGGTFGCTDGYIEFAYATVDADSAEKWLKKNRKHIESMHSGWGSRLNSIDIEIIHLH